MHKLTISFLILAVSYSQQNIIDTDPLTSSTYFIPNFEATWFRAAEYCQYAGLRLAVIDSAKKEANLYDAIKTSDVYHNASTAVWIGSNDLAEEGSFHWHDTGKPIRYANWAPGQPSNWEGKEHCVEVGVVTDRNWFELTWQWNDEDCLAMHYFACEK